LKPKAQQTNPADMVNRPADFSRYLKKIMKPLSSEQLKIASRKSIQNAGELIKDAEFQNS
jgi:hypothetical protein